MQLIDDNDKEEVIKYFAKSIQELEMNEFMQLKRKILSEYHPDRFQKFEDEAVTRMANEQFQRIQKLCDKIESFLENKEVIAENEIEQLKHNAIFSSTGLPFEIITTDKDLKYRLLGRNYRQLSSGDKIKIPNTMAYLYVEENYLNHSIGVQESIKLFLSFNDSDPIDTIAMWLFLQIKNTQSRLLVQRNLVEIDFEKILILLLKLTRKQLT